MRAIKISLVPKAPDPRHTESLPPMPRYRVSFEGRHEGVSYGLDPVYVGVAELVQSGGAASVRRVLQLSGTAYIMADHSLQESGVPDDDRFRLILASAAESLLVRVAREAEDDLASGRDPSGEKSALTLDSRDAATLVPGSGEKRCAFQSSSTRGLWCEADQAQGRTPTALPMCRACDLPDDRVRCSAMFHPTVSHHGAPTGPQVVSALCELGHPDPDGRCRPGGRDCWHRDIAAPVRALDAPRADAPERLADEVAYLRLGLERLLDTRLPRGSGELGIGIRLASPCGGREDFEDKVRAIGSLVSPMHVGKAAERKGVPGVDREAGSLVALGQLMDQVLSPDGPHAAPIRVLRRIIDARNLTSHHNEDDRLFALRELGLELPVEDHAIAWLRVAGAAETALRQLRRAVEDAIAEHEAGAAS